MNALIVLIDTDVLLDFLTDREPFTKNAKEIILKSQDGTFNAFLAPHSITNIFYILRKVYSVPERKERLLDLCRSISVVGVRHEEIVNALSNNDFTDVEDCLQAECARAIHAHYIITRNIEDFVHSEIPAISPEKLLKKLKDGKLVRR